MGITQDLGGVLGHLDRKEIPPPPPAITRDNTTHPRRLANKQTAGSLRRCRPLHRRLGLHRSLGDRYLLFLARIWSFFPSWKNLSMATLTHEIACGDLESCPISSPRHPSPESRLLPSSWVVIDNVRVNDNSAKFVYTFLFKVGRREFPIGRSSCRWWSHQTITSRVSIGPAPCVNMYKVCSTVLALGCGAIYNKSSIPRPG